MKPTFGTTGSRRRKQCELGEELYREWFVRMRFPAHDGEPREKGLPASWAVVPIEAPDRTVSGGTPSRGDTSNFGGDIPWVKTGELKTAFVHATAPHHRHP